MRCPRCANHVMPGVDECLACGASMTEPQAPAVTYPPRARAGADVIEQRSRVGVSSARVTRSFNRIYDRVAGGLTVGRMVFQLPPVLSALQGMFFGLWFFRKGRKDRGRVVLGAEVLLILLLLAEGFFFFRIDWLDLLAGLVLLAAGFEAASLALDGRGVKRGILLYVMAALTSLTTFSLLTIVLSFVLARAPVARFPAEFHVGGGTVRAGSLAWVEDVADGDAWLARGAVVIRYGRVFRVIGLPGDEVEVVDGAIYLNGYEAPAALDPIDPFWDDRSSRVNLDVVRAPESNYLTITREQYGPNIGLERNDRWRFHQVPMGGDLQRPRLVFWPYRDWRTF